MSSYVAGHGRLQSCWLCVAWYGSECHSTATVSSPTTLSVSRNVAIDCVQLQVRVHSAQQQSRPLLASLHSFENYSSIVCEYLLLSPFSRRRQTATVLGPISLQPAPATTPAVGHYHCRGLCYLQPLYLSTGSHTDAYTCVAFHLDCAVETCTEL